MGPRTDVYEFLLVIATGLFAEVSGQIADVVLGIQGTAPSGKDFKQRFLDLVRGNLPISLIHYDFDTELAVDMMAIQGVVVTGKGFLNILKEFDFFV